MFATTKYTPSTTLPRAKSGYNARAKRYSYAFNGQEQDNEIAGVGNILSAEYWEYDTRLGRRWNLDPIEYPWQSGYATFNNNPNYFNDPFGLEGEKPDATRETSDGCTEQFVSGKNGESGSWQDIPEVLVVADRLNKPNAPSSNVVEGYFKQTLTNAADYFNGFGKAFTSSFAGRETGTPYNGQNRDGMLAGHRTALLVGGLETFLGLGGGAVGLLTAPEGGLLIAAASTEITAHGALTITTAYQNLLLMNNISDDANGNPTNAESGENKVTESGGPKNGRKLSEDEIGDFLNNGNDWHYDGKAKDNFLKEFRKQLRGDKNADFHIDKDTKEVFLKTNKSQRWINTGKKFE